MVNLVIPVGIPGCGKSTWARTLLSEYSVVSSDQIRENTFGSLRAAHDVSKEQHEKNNQRVFDIFHRRIRNHLTNDRNVYADATNLNVRARKRLREIAEDTGASLHVVMFDNTNQAWNRNRAREEETRVPPKVMDKMLLQYEGAKKCIVPKLSNEGESYDSVTVIEGVL